VKSVHGSHPDLIALTGNIIDGGEGVDNETLTSLGQALAAIAPTFAVYGSHEVKSSYANQMEVALTSAGVHFLKDQAVTLPCNGSELTVMGLLEKPNPQFLERDPLQFLSLSSGQEQHPKLLLAHHPEAFLHYHEDPKKVPGPRPVGARRGGPDSFAGFRGALCAWPGATC